MRKTLLLTRLFKPEIGGTATLYSNICRRLPPDRVVVVAPGCSGDEAYDRSLPFKMHRVDDLSHLDGRVFGEVRRIRHIIRQEQIDRVLVGHIAFASTALILRTLFGQRYYVYVHGEELTGDLGGKVFEATKWACLREAEGIAAVSDFARELVIDYNPNVRVIPNAVDTREFRPCQRRDDLLRTHGLEGKRVLLTLARLEERKGQDKVIEILPEILRRFPDVMYLVVGGGEHRHALSAQIRAARLEDRVVLVGTVSDEDLVDYYNLCDLFVMPNREVRGDVEGFGICFLEAGACGKPVIGGRSGGVPSAIEHGVTGLLVDGRNAAEIGNAVCELLAKEELRGEMGAEGREHAMALGYERLVSSLSELMAL